MNASNPESVEQVIRDRRTINFYKPEMPPRDLIMRAVDVARWAPNHHLTEPWHFYLLTPATKEKICLLNSELVAIDKGQEAAAQKLDRWRRIPGWLVVTCDRSTDDTRQQEDYAACCCAIHSLSLFLWSQGIGVKWSTGKVTREPAFYDAIWADPDLERVVGLVWYGYAAEIPVSIRKPVADVLIEV